MTAADTNVRPVWRGPATTARRAGGSLLARLLLYFRKHLYKLDRKPLLLLFAASLTPACIIPVGPDFQDPLGEKNTPPYILATDPTEGTRTAISMVEFNVTIGDANVGDILHLKWVSEFPPSSSGITVQKTDVQPTGDGSEIRPPQTFRPGCSQVNKLLPTHTITVGISDREWAEPEDPNDLFATTDDAKPQFANWVWERSCPQ